MNWARGAGLLALPLGLVALAWTGISTPVPELALAQRPCMTPAQFRVGYDASPTPSLQMSGEVWTFPTTAWLQAEVCGPGTLTFSARGDTAKGEGAQLVVSLGTVPLLDVQVTTSKTLMVSIPEAGTLTVTFFNDLNDPVLGDRNLYISGLTFTEAPSAHAAPTSSAP